MLLYMASKPGIANVNREQELIRRFWNGCRNQEAVKWCTLSRGTDDDCTYEQCKERMLSMEARMIERVLDTGEFARAAESSAPKKPQNAAVPMEVDTILAGGAKKKTDGSKKNSKSKPRDGGKSGGSGKGGKGGNSGNSGKGNVAAVSSGGAKKKHSKNDDRKANACFNCHEPGHYTADCKKPKRQVHAVDAKTSGDTRYFVDDAECSTDEEWNPDESAIDDDGAVCAVSTERRRAAKSEDSESDMFLDGDSEDADIDCQSEPEQRIKVRARKKKREYDAEKRRRRLATNSPASKNVSSRGGERGAAHQPACRPRRQ